MRCKAVPALLCLRFDCPVDRAVLARPVNHSRESRGHLRFKTDRLGVDVASISNVPRRAFAVGSERPECKLAVVADTVYRLFDITLSAKIPVGEKRYPLSFARHFRERARAFQTPHGRVGLSDPRSQKRLKRPKFSTAFFPNRHSILSLKNRSSKPLYRTRLCLQRFGFTITRSSRSH